MHALPASMLTAPCVSLRMDSGSADSRPGFGPLDAEGSSMKRDVVTKKIHRIIRKVESERMPVHVREIYVFGSCARGIPECGELDLLVVTDRPKKEDDNRCECRMFMGFPDFRVRNSFSGPQMPIRRHCGPFEARFSIPARPSHGRRFLPYWNMLSGRRPLRRDDWAKLRFWITRRLLLWRLSSKGGKLVGMVASMNTFSGKTVYMGLA